MTDQTDGPQLFKTRPISVGIGLGLAFYLGLKGIPFYAIIGAIIPVLFGEYLRISLSHQNVGLSALPVLLFSSTIFCSMMYGGGYLVGLLFK